MDTKTTPVYVGPSEDRQSLAIRWLDGHVSTYEPRYLRLQCPCAQCVEEMSGRPLLDPANVPADLYPLEIRYVGRYALAFQWSDGHATGIYPFELLRELCRCPECLGAE